MIVLEGECPRLTIGQCALTDDPIPSKGRESFWKGIIAPFFPPSGSAYTAETLLIRSSDKGLCTREGA